MSLPLTISCLPSFLSPVWRLPLLHPYISSSLIVLSDWQDLGLKLSEKELSDMLLDADRSGSGLGVGEEEYLHILKHSTWV